MSLILNIYKFTAQPNSSSFKGLSSGKHITQNILKDIPVTKDKTEFTFLISKQKSQLVSKIQLFSDPLFPLLSVLQELNKDLYSTFYLPIIKN